MVGLWVGCECCGAVVERGKIGVAWTIAVCAPCALILGAGEVEAPGPVVGTAQLVIDEAIYGLVADDPAAFFLGQTPRHQLGRPALGEPVEDSLAQSIVAVQPGAGPAPGLRSEEHTSELQSLMRSSYAVFCLQKKNTTENTTPIIT